MTDVYRGTQESCKNPVKVALYLSFFPQSGRLRSVGFPRSADALYGGNSMQFENLVFGYQRIIWGLFKKMVIADRLAPLVAKVFSNYNNFDGAAILGRGAGIHDAAIYGVFRMYGYHHGKWRDLRCTIA